MLNFNQSLDQLLQSAVQHHQAGRLPQAEAIYRQILQQNPRHADALHLLGVLALQVKRYDTAVDLIRQAVAVHPNNPDAYYHLGGALHAQGRLEESIAAYRGAITLKPHFPAACNSLGISLHNKGQLGEAMTAYRQAIALEPRYAEAHNNLGNALRDNKQGSEALAAYRQAIALKADFPEAHYNLGCELKAQGQFDEAILAFRQAIALKSNFPHAHNNLGNVLKELGQLDEAVVASRQAIALRPDFADAYFNLGNELKDLGQVEEALAAYRQTIVLKPQAAEPHSSLVLVLNYLPSSTRRSLYEEARGWGKRHADPLNKFCPANEHDRNPERRMRVGFVSGDFYEHPSAVFFEPVLAARDRAKIEAYCYSQAARIDAVTERLRGLADHWRSTVGIADEAIAEMVRADRIDVLVDLNMHTSDNRLLVFARRPAPVQVTWLAYPGTTGMPAMDYRLTDRFLDPPEIGEKCYSEESVWLPDCFWCYGAPANAPEVHALPAASASYVTFGCLNNFCKVSPGTLEAWGKLLAAVPGSRLIVHAPEGSPQSKVLAVFARIGVEPERVELVPRMRKAEYLNTYGRIDIGLDPFPCAGGTTTCDALWMGVPVVTLAGQTAVGRGGVSILSNVGMRELITESTEGYIQKAVSMASDLNALAQTRASLRARMRASALMDAPRFARAIEGAFHDMWRKWCAAQGNRI